MNSIRKLIEAASNFDLFEELVSERVWYQGTMREFDKFSDAFTAGQLGIHLGSYEQAADRLGDEPGFILKAKVHVRNLIRLKDEGSWYGSDFVNQLKNNPKTSAGRWYDSMNDRNITSNLRTMGYDGVIYKNMFEGERHLPSIIIFEAKNIEIIDRIVIN